MDLISKDKVAIKLEKTSAKNPILFYESKVLKVLQNFEMLYVPKLYYSAQEGDYNVMVTSLLGPSLQDLVKYMGNTFTIWTVLKIAI